MRIFPYLTLSALALVAAVPALAAEPTPPAPVAALVPAELRRIAAEAYIYLYPLVTMDVTRRVQLDARQAEPKMVNRLNHSRTYPDALFREVVRPNFDTLYTMAWIDLSGGPVVVRVPDTKGRYYLLQFLDMWTDSFALPGTRTSGNGAGAFALVAPGWHGALPKGVSRIDAPTPWVWMIGRIQTNGPSDYPNVHAIQDGMTMAPLHRGVLAKAGPEFSLNLSKPPKEIVDTMPAADFVAYAMQLLRTTAPHPTDWSQLERIRRSGLERAAGSSTAQWAAIEAGIADGRREIASREGTINPRTNSWSYGTDTVGVYGNFYLKRAITARRGLGANPPEDAVYLSAYGDGTGQPLTGGRNYRLHFDKGKLPPTGAFWSLTLYDGDGFPVANSANRFAIGDRDPLRFNADGSLDLLIQPADPGGDLSANWLPSPASGKIALSIRIYAPRDEVLSRSWSPPQLVAQP